MFDQIVSILEKEFGDDAEAVVDDYYDDFGEFESAEEAATWILDRERYMRPRRMEPDEEEFEEWILTERGEPRTNGDIAEALRDFSNERARDSGTKPLS